jgi:hypothetical protein
MNPVTRIDFLGGVRIARDTFVYRVGLDEWASHLESLGCTRVADRRHRLTPAPGAEEILAEDESS